MEEQVSTAVEAFHRFTPKEEEADLWKAVLMEFLRHGESATHGIAGANLCVKALREQFPADAETESGVRAVSSSQTQAPPRFVSVFQQAGLPEPLEPLFCISEQDAQEYRASQAHAESTAQSDK